ncbi:MAG: hypothetical protein ACFFHV_17530 [Promethearchaeota archaeon]
MRLDDNEEDQFVCKDDNTGSLYCSPLFRKYNLNRNLLLANIKKNEARDLDITKLKGYNKKKAKILREHKGDIIFEKLIKFSESNVKRIIDEYRYARQELNKENGSKIVQKRINYFTLNEVSDVIKLGDPRFEKVIENPIKYGFEFFLYRWDWKDSTTIFKGVPLIDLPYIGFTCDFTSRIELEVESAIRNCANNSLTRFFDQAIIIALTNETERIIREINNIDREADLDPTIADIDTIVYWYISTKYWEAQKVLEFIISDEVIGKYFNIYIIEAHSSKSKALASEEHLIEFLNHKVNNKDVSGTIFPYGLNMKKGGHNRGIHINWLDMLALASLGLWLKDIANILSCVINRNINDAYLSRRLPKTFFKSFKKLQKIALSPVIWELIKEIDDLSMDDLRKILPYEYHGIKVRLIEWFGGPLINIQQFLKAGFYDLALIKNSFKNQLTIFRGYAPNTVMTWITQQDMTVLKIAEKYGIALDTMRKQIVPQISEFFTGQKMTYPKLKKYLRKEESTRFLQEGVMPEDILTNIFHLTVYTTDKRYLKRYMVRDFFEEFFNDSNLTFREIIEKYSSIPEKIIDNYKFFC